MGTAPRSLSSPTFPGSLPPAIIPRDGPTNESSADGLIGALRNASLSGTASADALLSAVADTARVLSGADGTALALETKGTILCRARSGSMAPQLGAPINTASGISGECLRTATMLVCHDALTDPRVDNEVCRALGIRSVAAVPVRGLSGLAGILEAFSSRPDAFDGDALSALRALAEIAGGTYKSVAPQAYVVEPVVPAARASTYSSLPLAPEDILGDTPEKGRLWIVVVVAVALLATVAVAWWSWESPADESATGLQTVRAAGAEQPRPDARRQVSPKPAPGYFTRHVESPQRNNVVQNAADLNRIEPGPSGSTATDVPTEGPTQSNTASEDADVAPPNVQVSENFNSAEMDRLTSVPTRLPYAAPRISEGVTEAVLIHKVEPVYPVQARTQRLGGRVTVSAMIGADGSIRQVTVVRGSPVLAEAAKAAIRQWRYRPAMLNGNPVEVQKEITFVFQP